MATLRAVPQVIKSDATSLIIFSGPPNVAVEWSLSGAGQLSEQSSSTGSNGAASAKYTPVNDGSESSSVVEITVTYGA